MNEQLKTIINSLLRMLSINTNISVKIENLMIGNNHINNNSSESSNNSTKAESPITWVDPSHSIYDQGIRSSGAPTW